MRIKNKTLRLKLTLFTCTLFLLICLLQAGISIYSSGLLAKSIMPSIPAQSSQWADNSNVAATIPIEAAQQNFNLIAIIAMLLLAILGCSGIYLIVRKELKPLEFLVQQVSIINMDNPVPPLEMAEPGNEIRLLTTAIDDMILRMNRSYLVQKNFSASAAHELRTPLAVIQNKLEVFRLKEGREISEHEALNEVLYQNIGRLSSLVDELLQLTNESNVDMSMPVSLSALANETAMELELVAIERGISIDVTGDATLIGNDCLLQRMVFNLMQNAVKYNIENGTVQVTINDSGDVIQFVVSDTGVGIPCDAKAHIYEPFFRVDKSRSREIGGTGLGLALVMRIAQQHGGVITVHDNFPQGTVFLLTFSKKAHK